eukprot:TRINITY_DN8881_c0_g1_i1.p1 TRINITY_DN8881_c0_g1~~TRINITY_DN8881_c0_g1_i1.p1  ORF type:complete len:206 (+),score=64.82 TRINITY_DN8881_c0_g1_i1:59-676(+)
MLSRASRGAFRAPFVRWCSSGVVSQAAALLAEEDPFKVLGLRRDYAVDEAELRQALRDRQLLFHPDRAVSLPKADQELFLRASAHCNQAADTVADPYRRLSSLLLLVCGRDLQNEGDEGHWQLAEHVGPDFLETIMEVHEELAESPDESRLREMNEKNTAAFNTVAETAAAALRSGSCDDAEKGLCRLSYYRNIRDLIRERLPVQ